MIDYYELDSLGRVQRVNAIITKKMLRPERIDLKAYGNNGFKWVCEVKCVSF